MLTIVPGMSLRFMQELYLFIYLFTYLFILLIGS